MRMKDDRLPKIVLFGQPSRALALAKESKSSSSGVGGRHKERFTWEDVKREALNRLGWRRSVRSCIGIRRLGAAVSC